MGNILYSFRQSKARDDVVNWLIENKIFYNERKISKYEPLRRIEIINFLKLSDNGFEDILKRNLKKN